MKIESTYDALSYLYNLSLNQTNLRFRGQAGFGWDIIPSIHRSSGLARYQTVTHERFLLEERPKEPSPPLTHTGFELEWLMVAQHYGVPTRLLDWTSDILIALYFACDDKKAMNEDGALIICNKDDYSQYNAYDESAMESQDLSFVSTNVVNPRMRLQSGCFMIWDMLRSTNLLVIVTTCGDITRETARAFSSKNSLCRAPESSRSLSSLIVSTQSAVTLSIRRMDT